MRSTLPEAVHDTWHRDVRWWDTAFYGIAVLTALALLLGPGPSPRTLLGIGAIAVMVGVYAGVGRRAARDRRRRPALVYLLVAIVTTTIATTQDDLATFLLFAVFSQIWMLLDSTLLSAALSTVLCVAVTVALTVEESHGGFDPTVLAEIAPRMGVALIFAIGLGIWTAHTLRQSERHAQIAHELGLARAELTEASRVAGMTAERERLSREIHDTLAQGFISIVMLSQAASADLDRGALDDARGRLDLIEATAREDLAEARALVTASAPLPLGGGATLTDALTRVADRFTAESGVRARTAWGTVPALSNAQEVVLLRAAQEALANVRRHAAAGCVRMSIGTTVGGVALTVTDDGRGFGSGAVEGFGLRGMRDRVAAEGGSVRLQERPGGGTRLVVEVPLMEEVV